ncbi:E3 ubiquitin-protein ligase DCST1 isoform X7 [Panthera pardus]|uniref:E3 ubiquitin-protein ligase DCST1 isoform X7 n=1 Tax=Panthera pardus TaxID=9691 RepID=A0A9W2W1L3_PANPR|nr:E3 ubiquitin-protein ligase DCST1 isoform X7 [Panthera pardus]
MLRTTARDTLGSSAPTGAMAAGSKRVPVSRRRPRGSGAPPGSRNPSPHSKVPRLYHTCAGGPYPAAGLGRAREVSNLLPQVSEQRGERQTRQAVGAAEGPERRGQSGGHLWDESGCRLMVITPHGDGATGQRKLPHTSESVPETLPFPRASQPPGIRPVSPAPPSPTVGPQRPPLSPSGPPPSHALSSSLPHLCPASSGPPRLLQEAPGSCRSPSLSPPQAPNPDEARPSQKSGLLACWANVLDPAAVQRLLNWGLPAPCGRLLQRQPGEFPVTAFLLGAGTGGLLAMGLFQLLVNPMNIYEDQKVVTLYSLVGLGAVGWGTSPHIRCASLLLVPKMLGKEGRLFVLGYALAAIYEGQQSFTESRDSEPVQGLRGPGCPGEQRDGLQPRGRREPRGDGPGRGDPPSPTFRAPSLHTEDRWKFGAAVASQWRATSGRPMIPSTGLSATWKGNFQPLLTSRSFSYVDSYNGDIRFDNIYISTYFCQIDERRKKLGKRTLLPLRRAEEKTVIFPCSPFMQASEMRNVVRELAETLPVLLLLLVLCGLDWALYSVFNTIRHHSFLQYSFRSSHKLEVKVGGDSMLARLLRKTIGALNTSSETTVDSSNMRCLPQPVSLNPRAYVRAALPVGLLLCLCLLQAFGYRLRRVIAAFYFPKREKKRVLFLYNDLLRKRAAFTKLRRAAIVSRAQRQRAPRHHLADVLHRRCPLLRRWLRRRCVVCQAPETPEAYVCPTPDCAAVYCRSCWDDMRRRCPACTPREELSSSAYNDSNDDATYAE